LGLEERGIEELVEEKINDKNRSSKYIYLIITTNNKYIHI
jgi:hypothetical protein